MKNILSFAMLISAVAGLLSFMAIPSLSIIHPSVTQHELNLYRASHAVGGFALWALAAFLFRRLDMKT